MGGKTLKTIDELIDEFFTLFEGKPSVNSIVRNNTRNDAFELVVLKILYGKILDLQFDIEHIDELAKYIIAPPDEKIDIFIEKESGDEQYFDVIQVKNTSLSESELKSAISDMERTISDFCKSPLNISSESCREILSSSNLGTINKTNCQYYVIHRGEKREFNGIKDNEHVLNLIDLNVLREGNQDKVEEDILSLNGCDNYLEYGKKDDRQNAIICNICAYDLAVLNNKYYSTEIGRNILFGHNLRDSLNPKKSKSYGVMKKTIEKCSDNFWYYNNGITIVAEHVEPTSDESKTDIKLKIFSIVNGAQTTSSLGMILKDAIRDGQHKTIDALKNAYVMARILKVSSDETKNAIAIYNNTQNPINNRDMVANNIEQKKLHNWLLDTSYPQIYVEIRRGTKIPNSFDKKFLHRKTTNEVLAQLAYAGFYLSPHTAKDKKSSLFFNDTSQTAYNMNEIYHKIFNYNPENPEDNGILLKKSKYEIDELLFVQQLYKDGKQYLKKKIQERLNQEKSQYDQADNDGKIMIQPRILRDESMLETIGICQFYYITTYFELTEQSALNFGLKRYDYEKYYQDKLYKGQLIAESANFILMKTIEIINKNAKENGKATNINNWVRSAACQKHFLETLRNDIGFDMDLQTRFDEFVEKYKVVPI